MSRQNADEAKHISLDVKNSHSFSLFSPPHSASITHTDSKISVQKAHLIIEIESDLKENFRAFGFSTKFFSDQKVESILSVKTIKPN